MALTQATHSKPHSTPLSPVGNMGPVMAGPDTAHTVQHDDRLPNLAMRLQTSLELEDTLQQFSDEVNAMVPHDGLAFAGTGTEGKRDRDDCLIGKKARHRLSYALKINQSHLGTLEISRRRRFSAQETLEAENLICALLYPLRNALLYRDAVRAAHKDALTGCSNRAAFDEALGREVLLAQRHDRPLGIIVIDIDHFKTVNDTHGHTTGDCLLKALAHTAENTVRLSDQLFRYGGEEFVVLLPETDIKGVKRLAERIRRRIETLDCICEGNHISMTASLGIATLNADDTEEGFFRRADAALYRAKNEGRNCTRVAD